MNKIKTVFIGSNYYSHSKQVYASVLKQSDLFEVAGVVLPENEREKYSDRVSRLDGIKELTLEQALNDSIIEAAIIETDEIHLTKYALMFAKAGKHIHMEKPGGIDPLLFEELIDTVKQSKKTFHIGYMYRYNKIISDILQKAKNGQYGQILSVEAQMNCIHKPDVRDWLKTLPGGMMFYLGCHLIDLILQLQGAPDRVIPFNKSTGLEDIHSDDLCLAVFEYKNGLSFAKTADIEYGGFARRQLVITGSKATVEINPLEVLTETEEIFTEWTQRQSAKWHDRGQKHISDRFDRYDSMMEGFAKIVRGEKENPFTPDYELLLYKTLIKCVTKEND